MEFDRIAWEIVAANKMRLFPEDAAATVEIVDLALGPAANAHDGRFGRRLFIRYRRDGTAASLRLWLKFGPGLDALFPVLADYDRRLAGRVFPHPYFAWASPRDGSAVLATAFVDGALLLDRVRRAALSRRIARLVPVFRSNGAKMRAFHDASAEAGTLAVADIAGRVAAAVRGTPHLSPAERDAVTGGLGHCLQGLGVAVLPAVRTHNDWVLRNVMVTPDGADYVIDNDDLCAGPYWRWHDVMLFLLDIETQLKWSPLLTRPMLARLWQAFWQGYLGRRGVPDGLTPAQLAAVFYLVRLQWLVEGVVHAPHLAILLDGRRRNRRVRERLKQTALRGQHALLDFPLGADDMAAEEAAARCGTAAGLAL